MTLAETNVPQPIFGDQGFLAPQEADILAGALADLTAVFGGDLNTSLETPQGQLATSYAAEIAFLYDLFVKYTNQTDPAFASGRMQDALAAIYFLTRNQALPTTVACDCTGLVGTVIPQGALAQDIAGNQYQSNALATIPASGTVSVTFVNLVNGPIACPETTLTTIVTGIAGWDTINNPADGEIGVFVESRAAFEQRRQDSVAGNSAGAVGSVIGAVAKVAGILDYWGYNNATGSPATIAGVSIPARSIWITAVGGTDADVAQAIFSKVGPGAGQGGNTTVTVFDDNPLYVSPPSYSITFERPSPLGILFGVSLVNGPDVPSNAAVLIQNAIIAAFGGNGLTPRPRVAALILASDFLPTLFALGSWVRVRSLLINSNNTPSAVINGSISATTLTVNSVTSGSVAIGQLITAVGVAEGTVVVSGSGSSWVIAPTQTVSSEAMTLTAPNQNSVQVQGDQSPTTDANLIAVSIT